jgi:tyrosyl-tRNA synthetase
MGHHVIFLIGDFTATIGDPTGKNETRPALTHQEVLENSKTYAEQVFKILDPKKTEVAYNGTWMNKFSAQDFVKLSAQYTVSRMIERDDFTKRFQEHRPISIHEFLYPLVQGYDSVALKSDVELGGTDQKFNMLVGREIQKSYGVEPQCVITVPIIEGLDGVKKMSKSYDNYIGVTESPRDMFGKTMRISDDLMWKYYEALTDKTIDEIAQMKSDVASGKLHPKAAKVNLAKFFVTRFHNADAAQKEEQYFEETFSKKQVSADIETRTLSTQEIAANCNGDLSSDKQSVSIGILNLIKGLGMADSTSKARQLVEQNAVEMNGEKVKNPKAKITMSVGDSPILKVGKKKLLKLVIAKEKS